MKRPNAHTHAAAAALVMLPLLASLAACRADDPPTQHTRGSDDAAQSAPATRDVPEQSGAPAHTPAQAEPPTHSPAAPPRPGGAIVPKPEPLEPRAFTLEDRYLDAARRGDLDMLKRCMEKGVDLRAKDGFASSALLLAAREGRNLEMVKLLRERGLAADEPDTGGRTPLSWAAHHGDVGIVSYLLEQGAAVDSKDAQGQTPLLHAAMTGSRDVVERLLAAGAQADTADRFGDTPLMHACGKGYDEIARLLVEKGADPARKDQEGRTARERAAATTTFCRELPQTKPAG